MDIAVAEVPASSATYFLAHDRGGHVDHHVLYHGLDDRARERLATADVLFLGNSRLMFALDRQALRAVMPTTGLTYYVLGFGHDETYEFPLALIERFDLRPAVVVANADGFFAGVQSELAARVQEEGWFDAVKRRLEATAAHAVRRRLHRFVPHWPDLIAGGREFVIYRSALDGTWSVGTPFPQTGPLPLAPEPPAVSLEPRVVDRARAFKAALEKRGTRLVIGLVPSPDFPRARARALAAAIGVPAVTPAVDRPRTMDGSHLTAESAREFAELFLRELVPVLEEGEGQ